MKHNKLFQRALTFGIVMVFMMLAVLPAAAQEGEDVTVFDTPVLAGDITLEERGAFALLAIAERVISSALVLVEADPALVLEEGQVAVEDNELDAGLDEFQILQPSTIVALRVSFEILDDIADGLDDYTTIIEADIAEELTISEEVLGDIDVEEDEGVIEEEEEEEEVFEQDVLEGIDIEIDIAGGECGDLDTLVRAARRDIARALGFFGRFGGEQPVNPEARLLALDALRIHNTQVQEALTCLAEVLPQQ